MNLCLPASWKRLHPPLPGLGSEELVEVYCTVKRADETVYAKVWNCVRNWEVWEKATQDLRSSLLKKALDDRNQASEYKYKTETFDHERLLQDHSKF